MKKSLFVMIAVICSVVILSSCLFSEGSVKTVAEVNTVSVAHKTEENAILSILNDNYVYGKDFDNVDDIVNCSVNIFKSSVTDEGYVSESLVSDFVYDMYGIEIIDMSNLNPEYSYKSGYVYALPSFTRYEHSNIKLTANEDGTVTAETDISVISLNGNAELLKAKTLLVKNEKSKLGYNIVYSEIFSDKACI